MSDHDAISPEPGSVRLERLLPGPIERLWRYLTDAEMRSKWLAGGAFELRLGGLARLEFRHDTLSADPTPEAYRNAPCDFEGQITAYDPPRLLRYTWGASRGDASEVTFELEPVGDRVRLTLTHRKLADRAARTGVASGWHAHLALLEDALSGTAPRGFWSTFARADSEYRRREL
jgi:uncharacterized protein YndB with AHSA1/START domain